MPPYFPDARLLRPYTLPTCPTRVHHYINLTNGLEALSNLVDHVPPASVQFCRFQSSHCEASRPDFLLRNLETSMLFQLARGHCVLVYDYGSRNKKRGAPRALWMGVEFVRWALERVWYKVEGRPVWVRGNNVAGEYDRLLKDLDSQTYKKLKYFRRYIERDIERDGVEEDSRVQLYGVYADTEHDCDDGFYLRMAREFDDAVGVDGRTGVSGAWRAALAGGEAFDGRDAGGAMHPVERVLGMRVYFGGIDPVTYERYMEKEKKEKEKSRA